MDISISDMVNSVLKYLGVFGHYVKQEKAILPDKIRIFKSSEQAALLTAEYKPGKRNWTHAHRRGRSCRKCLTTSI